MVSRDDDRLYLGDTETFELGQTKADGTVRGVRAVEEVARMDDIIGFSLDNSIDYLGKGIVKIGFALVDTGFIDDLKIVKPQMGIGEMKNSQRVPLAKNIIYRTIMIFCLK